MVTLDGLHLHLAEIRCVRARPPPDVADHIPITKLFGEYLRLTCVSLYPEWITSYRSHAGVDGVLMPHLYYKIISQGGVLLKHWALNTVCSVPVPLNQY